MYRALGHDKLIFKRMFLGIEGFESLFKPKNFVGLMWKMTMLLLGKHGVRSCHLFGKEDMIASRFRFFGMKPEENAKVVFGDKEVNGSAITNDSIGDMSFLKLLSRPAQVRIVLPTVEKPEDSCTFYESLIQDSLKSFKEMTVSNFTLDSLYAQFLGTYSEVTMVPTEYVFQRHLVKDMLDRDPELWDKYFSLKNASRGHPSFLKAGPHAKLDWDVMHLTFTLYKKLYEDASRSCEPDVLRSRFLQGNNNDSWRDQDLKSSEIFAKACLKKYMSKAGACWKVNRFLYFSFHYVFIRMMTYAICYWVMKDSERENGASSLISRDMAADGSDRTIVSRAMFLQKGLPLLQRVLYKTRLEILEFVSETKDSENPSCTRRKYDLVELEKPGILVSNYNAQL